MYTPSKEQLKQLEILFELIDKCKEKEIEIWIVGGYGLDALYGSLTRDHGDIDLIVWEKDLLAVGKMVEEMGFMKDANEAEKNKKVYRPEATVAVNDLFKIEFGSIEFYGQFFPKETPLESLISKSENGVIMGKTIKTLTLKGYEITAEVQNQRAVRGNWGEYKHQKHFEKMISVLNEKKDIMNHMTDFQNISNNDNNSSQNVVVAEPIKKRVDVKKILIVLMGIIILILGYLLMRCVTIKMDDMVFDVEDDWELLEEESTPALTREQEYEMTQTKINEDGIRFEGGDGLSIEKAIVIVGAKNESEGVAAEYLYLNDKYGPRGEGYVLQSQRMKMEKDRVYDSLKIEVPALDQTLEYFFDITDFFGKW